MADLVERSVDRLELGRLAWQLRGRDDRVHQRHAALAFRMGDELDPVADLG